MALGLNQIQSSVITPEERERIRVLQRELYRIDKLRLENRTVEDDTTRRLVLDEWNEWLKEIRWRLRFWGNPEPPLRPNNKFIDADEMYRKFVEWYNRPTD